MNGNEVINHIATELCDVRDELTTYRKEISARRNLEEKDECMSIADDAISDLDELIKQIEAKKVSMLGVA